MQAENSENSTMDNTQLPNNRRQSHKLKWMKYNAGLDKHDYIEKH